MLFSFRTKNRLNRKLKEQNRQLVGLSEQLEETTQAKLAFFTNISHEFKTPLSLIGGPIDDLMSRTDLPADVRTSLDILKRNSSKLHRLITELLDFRTYENGKVVINYSVGNLDDFFRDIVKMFSHVVSRRHLRFSYETDGGDYNIPFDPIKLEKVFTNLLSNAFNHVDKEGTIRIRLRSEGSGPDRSVILSVFNSGSYIPPENREKIFEEFYTLDADQKGTGIGLALVVSIVGAIGGSIRVESDPGSGTEFLVRIPVEEAIHTDARIDNQSYVPEFARLKLATMEEDDTGPDLWDGAGDGEGLRSVLVIEDNIGMRQYLRLVLSSDYRVALAKDGETGLAKAIRIVPDIILCDIMMPGMDGYAVCAALRKNPATKHIPVILLTACSLDEQKAQGYESGADAFMQKPFNVATLKVRMKKLLEKHDEIASTIRGDWLIGRDAGGLSSESIKVLNQLREYVEGHLQDLISLDDLARHLGWSKSKLYRELKEVTDYSPIDLVNLIRCRKAVDLMISERRNVTEAAFLTGFSSPSYFSRTFLKYYHMRPTEYIKNKQPSNSVQ